MANKVKKTAAAGVKDIGLDVEAPKSPCKDQHCPFHGRLSVRGMVLDGIVVSAKMQGTITVQREYMRYVPKYERYEKRTNSYLAHAPSCIHPELGDSVSIMECRPLSKRVSYVVIENKKQG
ncbi:MAG: 30S ribosomal protein S17 [Euryarchaeota archaeon RBG_13_57_23]|nr:MAG: 30S ribosomal protein S17 [Euryarchaeota archaeon RBG_13_57_23]